MNNKVTAKIEVTLDEFVIEELEAKGYSKEEIMARVQKELSYLNWGMTQIISDIENIEVSEVEA